MYLAYFDDSGSEPSSELCVFGGVVVPGDGFGNLEQWGRMAVQDLLPEEKLNSFQEFKAGDLYFGQRYFADIDEERRRKSMLLLANAITVSGCPFIYCAVNTHELKHHPLGSAKPVDIAFRACLIHLEKWARSQHRQHDEVIKIDFSNMCVVVADESDGDLKKQIQRTFRLKRKRRHLPMAADDLWHIHDSMYFGSSADSIGLQMADVCAWLMRRLLLGLTTDPRMLAELRQVAICADPDPDLSRWPGLFRSHLDVSPVSEPTSET